MATTQTRSQGFKDALSQHVARTSGKSADTDEAKYASAVAAARSSLPENASEADFKKAIDAEFKNMGATKSGREMRGENAWTDFVNGVNDFSRNVNVGIGNAIDWAWDNSAGNLAGLAGEDAGNAVKNWMTGEDLALVPDIATDVALYASGVGIPVAIAREALRSGRDIGEAISGKDAITLEDLDGSQRAAKGLLGVGGIALSAIPGIGKIRNIAGRASKKVAAEAVTKAEEAEKVAKEAGEKTIADATKTYEAAAKKAKEASSASDAKKAAEEAASAYDAKKAANADILKATQALESARNQAEKSTISRVGNVMAKDAKGFSEAIKNIPETWRSSRDRRAATISLKRAMQKANRGDLKDAKDLAKDGDSARAEALKKALSDSDEPITDEALEEILSTAGIKGIEKLGVRNSGKFKAGVIPPFMPRYGNSVKDVIQDVGIRSNSAYQDAVDRTLIDQALGNIIKDAKAAELEGKKGIVPALQRAGNAVGGGRELNDPISFAKATLGGQLASMSLVPLAMQSQYGGDYIDNLQKVGDDIVENGIGKYLVATFPVGGGRMVAQTSIPSINRYLGTYHPYGAIRAKDTVNQFQETSREDTNKNGYEKALDNMGKRR